MNSRLIDFSEDENDIAGLHGTGNVLNENPIASNNLMQSDPDNIGGEDFENTLARAG